MKPLLIPKKKCPICKKRYLWVLVDGWVFCPRQKCATSGEAFASYSDMCKKSKG